MIRLYYNKRGPLPWSVDSGPDTDEYLFTAVYVRAFGETRTSSAGDNIHIPTAWIEFPQGTSFTPNPDGSATIR